MNLDKLYEMSIVRGKDEKSIEFGAKCNNILIDGLSFSAFNERIRQPDVLHLEGTFKEYWLQLWQKMKNRLQNEADDIKNNDY